MALLQDELKIKKICYLLEVNLALPSYQRPYSWSVRSTNTLFIDTYNAYQEGIQEYRIGSVILHKELKYNIVDGQQRLTTLSILLYLTRLFSLIQHHYLTFLLLLFFIH